MTITGDDQITADWFNSDAEFNQVYPQEIQRLAKRHWTPLQIAQKSASFLAAENNVRVLDIGSGAGKFCLAAAFYKPTATFTGVEQRKNLVNIAESARQTLQLENVSSMPISPRLILPNTIISTSIIHFMKTWPALIK